MSKIYEFVTVGGSKMRVVNYPDGPADIFIYIEECHWSGVSLDENTKKALAKAIEK